MVKYRNVRVKMKGGKTRIQRAMVLASGKLKFVKNLHKSRSSKAAPRQKTSKRRVVHIARRRKKSRGGGKSFVRSAEKLLTGITLVAPGAISLIQRPNAEGAKDALWKYSGINANAGGRFEWQGLIQGWGPVVCFTAAKIAAHKIMGLLRRF